MVGHAGHREKKNSKQETGNQTALTVTKALTKTTNCTCRAKKSGGAQQQNL